LTKAEKEKRKRKRKRKKEKEQEQEQEFKKMFKGGEEAQVYHQCFQKGQSEQGSSPLAYRQPSKGSQPFSANLYCPR